MIINKLTNPCQLILIAISLLNMKTSKGHPIEKLSTEPDLKDEVRYPNGTVIGNYLYTDNGGNPIHVKYFADDGGYGVELKSVKVIDSSTGTPTATPLPKIPFELLKPIESPFGSELATHDLHKSYYRNKYKINNNINKASNKKLAKSSLEYEILYQNNLQTPALYGTDKVKVYLGKQNRIARTALDDDEAAKYCNQF